MRYHECVFGSTGIPENMGSLWGWYEYKRGDTVIVSDYHNKFMILPDVFANVDLTKVSILLSLPACDTSRKRLLGKITDYLQAREPKIVRAYFDTGVTKITWKQRHATGYGQFSGARGMTLPKEFILIKQ